LFNSPSTLFPKPPPAVYFLDQTKALVKKIESGPFHNISFVVKVPHPVDGIRATVPDLIASIIKPGIPLLNVVFPDFITPRTGIGDDQFREKKQANPDKNRSYDNRRSRWQAAAFEPLRMGLLKENIEP
jgi:hypothetical protein